MQALEFGLVALKPPYKEQGTFDSILRPRMEPCDGQGDSSQHPLGPR